MNIFSRKIVTFLIVVFWQSSLGTNAALKDFSNVTTKNLGQNGYYKLPDGLMIQWGYSTTGGSGKYIYLPQSFFDTNFSISIVSNSTASKGVVVTMINTVSKTYFQVESRYNDANTVSTAGEGFRWIAIGRWK